jgi:hypothetical protein
MYISDNHDQGRRAVPWVLIPSELRRARLAKKWDRKTAAKKCGLTEKSLHRHEDESEAPDVLREDSVDGYCKGFGPEPPFIHWVDATELPKYRAARKQSQPILPSLSERAKRELALHAHQTITVGERMLDLVGNVLLKDCATACALFDGKCYGVEGAVIDQGEISAPTARVLDAAIGSGARFRMERQVADGLPVRIDVMTRTADHTRQLMDAHKTGRPVRVAARVVVKPPEGAFIGFVGFGKTPAPKPWIFVIDEIAPSIATAA